MSIRSNLAAAGLSLAVVLGGVAVANAAAATTEMAKPATSMDKKVHKTSTTKKHKKNKTEMAKPATSETAPK